mmetsp:Transcript_61712/g.151897  ORF Transcript_61712/g.151897 Transcript_61712/m.151897 type:complete len:451 (+) Transcript_61712:337-1689(+)
MSLLALGSEAISFSAALAFNLTANVLAAYAFGSGSGDGLCSNGTCTAGLPLTYSANYTPAVLSAVPEDKRQLMFGRMEGLLPQPEEAGGTIVIFGARGGDDKNPGDEHRADTIPMCNSVIERGWSCWPIFYSDAVHDAILDFTAGFDGYISRVNPDVYEGVSMQRYEELLSQLGESGLAAMPHPRLMQKFGSKDALFKIRHLRTGLPDTTAYYDEEAFRETFPANLATGPRVLKQNRGSQGEGIWVCRLEEEEAYRRLGRVPLDAVVVLTEAVDNHVERKTLAELLDFASGYLKEVDGEKGELIDQVFMPRIVEGELRVLFVGNKPLQIVHKKPKEGGISATLKSGATYTKYPPDHPAFERLMNSFVKKDLPKLLPSLGLGEHPLPLLWTADFILGPARPPWSGDKDYYFVGELNCSCVGITQNLEVTGPVADEAIRICLENRKRKQGIN